MHPIARYVDKLASAYEAGLLGAPCPNEFHGAYREGQERRSHTIKYQGREHMFNDRDGITYGSSTEKRQIRESIELAGEEADQSLGAWISAAESSTAKKVVDN